MLVAYVRRWPESNPHGVTIGDQDTRGSTGAVPSKEAGRRVVDIVTVADLDRLQRRVSDVKICESHPKLAVSCRLDDPGEAGAVGIPTGIIRRWNFPRLACIDGDSHSCCKKKVKHCRVLSIFLESTQRINKIINKYGFTLLPWCQHCILLTLTPSRL